MERCTIEDMKECNSTPVGKYVIVTVLSDCKMKETEAVYHSGGKGDNKAEVRDH